MSGDYKRKFRKNLVVVLYSKNSSNAFRRLRRRGASPANRGFAAPMTISSFSLAANLEDAI